MMNLAKGVKITGFRRGGQCPIKNGMNFIFGYAVTCFLRYRALSATHNNQSLDVGSIRCEAMNVKCNQVAKKKEKEKKGDGNIHFWQMLLMLMSVILISLSVHKICTIRNLHGWYSTFGP